MEVSSKRKIGNFQIFDSSDSKVWEEEYNRIMDDKYKKNTRNYSKIIHGSEYKDEGQPPIFIVPRVRGGPSYKSVKLVNENGRELSSDDIFYAPISKGYSMQDVSSFTLGPIIGEGLCLVNAAFSKSIGVKHIEGGGVVDYKRKNFWKGSRKPIRKIELVNDVNMKVDGKVVGIHTWLKDNENLWLNEWEKWRRSVALCSLGDFHWIDDSPTIAYKYGDRYLNFVEWKKECYIKPSYELLPKVGVYQFLSFCLKEGRRPLGLVHPKGMDGEERPISKEYITSLFNHPDIMACQPYVVAGKLLNVEV